MRPVLLSIACALVLVMAPACSKEKPLPRPNVTIPGVMQEHPLTRDAPPGHVFVYDANLVFHAKIGPSDPEFRVAILEATLEGEYVHQTYRATRLGRATLGAEGWDVVPLDGKLTITETSVIAELTGAEASRWNGEYLTPAEAQRRQRTNAPKTEAEDGGAGPPPPCQRYSDCVCGLDAAAMQKGGDNPFRKPCEESKRLLITAPDDPKACTLGLSLQRELAPKLGYALPAACAE